MLIIRNFASLLAVAFAFAVLPACPDDGAGPGPGEGEGEGEGEVGATEDMELIGEPLTVDIAPILSSGIAITTRADGRAAFVYVEQGAGTVECNLFGGDTVTEPTVDVKVADEQPDGTFRIRTVGAAPPIGAVGVDIGTDPASDALVVAFNGGEPANGVCGASDLMIGVEGAGDAFVVTTLAQNASDGSGPCRQEFQPLCAQGDFVGRFPALAISDAAYRIAYIDQHFGFGETDLFESDIEMVRGTQPAAVTDILTVNAEAGGGYFTGIALREDNTAVVAHQIIGNNQQDEGVYADMEQGDGTILETLLVENPEVSSRIAVAARDDQGIFVAFRENATAQLLLFHSVDNGASFGFEAPEQLSVTGFNPQLAFLSDGTMVLAYGHCRDVDDGVDLCNPNEDGVRITWRSPGTTQFLKHTFLGDDEDTEGVSVDMVVTADDVITTLSFNASQSQATIHKIQRVTR